MEKARAGVPGRASCAISRGSVELFRQLHAAHALEVTLHGGSLLALALGGGLLVELAGAQLGEQAQLLDGALEAAQRHVKRLVFLDTNGRHDFLNSACGGRRSRTSTEGSPPVGSIRPVGVCQQSPRL